MTKFKQPIVFQSRVIDLVDLEEKLKSGYVWGRMEENEFFSHAALLHAYFVRFIDEDPDGYIQFSKELKDAIGVDFSEGRYGKLPRPLALDNRTGDLYQVVSVDYNREGIVTSIIAREGDTIKYIYNDLPQTAHITGMAHKTDLILMHDGWY